MFPYYSTLLVVHNPRDGTIHRQLASLESMPDSPFSSRLGCIARSCWESLCERLPAVRVRDLVPSGGSAYGDDQNPSRTAPLHGLRAAAPSVGRTPPGLNLSDTVGRCSANEENESV